MKSATTLSAGTQLGAFKITGQLGIGGVGEVYQATDTKLGHEVAIETLSEAGGSQEQGSRKRVQTQ